MTLRLYWTGEPSFRACNAGQQAVVPGKLLQYAIGNNGSGRIRVPHG